MYIVVDERQLVTAGYMASFDREGVPSFGLYASTSPSPNLPLLSFLVGLLAAGVSTLDAPTRSLIARSTSFTSPTIIVSQRTSGDMHAAVMVLRSLAAGIFILAMPMRAFGQLKLQRTKRIALLGVFMVGGVAVIASIVRLYALWVYAVTDDPPYDDIFILLLSYFMSFKCSHYNISKQIYL